MPGKNQTTALSTTQIANKPPSEIESLVESIDHERKARKIHDTQPVKTAGGHGTFLARYGHLGKQTPEERARDDRRRNETARREHEANRRGLWQAVSTQRGKRYEGCRLGNYQTICKGQEDALTAIYDYANNVKERVESGINCVLFGPVGTGKDHLMMALAHVATYHQGLRVTWVNGVDLFAGMRDLISSGGSEVKFAADLVKPNILAISDPLPQRGEMTDFQTSLLFRIIDGRYSDLKPTWVTLNVKDPADAARRLTPQIHDRLRHDALTVPCDWQSYRG